MAFSVKKYYLTANTGSLSSTISSCRNGLSTSGAKNLVSDGASIIWAGSDAQTNTMLALSNISGKTEALANQLDRLAKIPPKIETYKTKYSKYQDYKSKAAKWKHYMNTHSDEKDTLMYRSAKSNYNKQHKNMKDVEEELIKLGKELDGLLGI